MIIGLTYLRDSYGTRAKGRPFTPLSPGYLEAWGNPVWQDEFDYVNPDTGTRELDPAKWNIRDRDEFGLLFDAAEPDRNQVSVDENGILHVKGEWLDTPYARPGGSSGSPLITHRTGYIDTRPLSPGDTSFTQQYGRWEIRAKMPTGPQTHGALSAFWLRNSLSGEIDIVESWGHISAPTEKGQLPGSSTMTFHSHTTGSSAPGYQKAFWRINEMLKDYDNMAWSFISKNLPNTPAFDEFRTWAFEYTPTYLAGYYEGQRFAYTTPAETPWLWNADYFGAPFHMRLNLHIGPSATYWGYPDPDHHEWTQDPLDYQIQYVRVYEYKEEN